jgi:hypothetical protein
MSARAYCVVFEGTMPYLKEEGISNLISMTCGDGVVLIHSRREHVERGEHVECAAGGLEEVDDLLMLDVVVAVALDVERGRAGGMLGELVTPEIRVWEALVDPVLVH